MRRFHRPPLLSVHVRHRSLLMVLFLAGATVSGGAQTQDLAIRARRGMDAMSAGRFDEAAALYAEIVRALPNEPGMRLNLGMALSMAGRPADALPHLEEALKLRPGLLPAWLFLGTVRLELGQPAQAVEPLQKFLTAQPENVDVRQRLADALLALERYPQAARQFRTLSEQASGSPRVWYGLGRSYEGVARVALEELQRSAPESPELLRLIAEAMAAAGRDADALRLYREALEKRPGQAEVHEAVARIYERRDHADWAAVEREKARGIAPPDCASPSLECDYRAGRYDAIFAATHSLDTAEARYWLSRAAGALARQAFARLGQLPPSPEATLLKIEIMIAQKQPMAEGIEELRKAAKAWPEDVRIQRELAQVLFMVNDAEAALPILEGLLEREPDSAEVGLMLGETWLKMLRPDKAIPFLERVVARDPALLRAQATLGRAYMEIDQPAKAATALEAALPTDRDGSLYYQLARAYRATGERDRAREALKKFQELRDAAEAEAQSLEQEFAITPPQ